MMNKKGILITLEGNEGCGKTTQIKLLRDWLGRCGKKVFLTREPGGTPTSDAIRSILLDDDKKNISPVTETLLYMASRAQLVNDVIKPKLGQGYIILCDRWLDATLAYQGFGGGVDARWIEALGKKVTQGIRPKRTVFFDLPLEIGLKRATECRSADRIEKKSVAFHRKVRQGYLWIAEKEPRRFKTLKVDSAESISDIHERIKAILKDVV